MSLRSPVALAQLIAVKSFKFIDLFAGIGGFHHALKKIGGECVLTCELDEECAQVYQAIFPDSKKPGHFVTNIRTITRKDINDPDSAKSEAAIQKMVPEHDVLCAGFPCQPFSKSGSQQGFKDTTRGTLFFDIMEIVRARRPRYLILENVRNLAGPRHRDTWATIRDTIRLEGYETLDEPIVLSPHLLHPDDGGAPQVRERVFILASNHSGDIDRIKTLAEDIQTGEVSGTWDSHDWSIADFLLPDSEIPNVEKYRLNEDEKGWVDAWDWFVRNIPDDNLPGFPIWSQDFVTKPVIPKNCPAWKENFLRKNSAFYIKHKSIIDRWKKMRWGKTQKTVEEFPPSRQMFEWQAKRHHPHQAGRKLDDLVLQFRPSGIRVKPPTYLPALVAITQTSVVGPDVASGIKDYRELTPQEAAQLQGMPTNIFKKAKVEDRAAYKQLGNAVNVGVIRYIAKRVIQGKGGRLRQTTFL